MIITEQGCCGRCGSVLTNIDLEFSKRPDREYCLYKYSGKCGACMKKCVNHAFECTEQGVVYDRYKCNEQIYEKIVPVYPIGTGDACGKCMCGLPCSLGIPEV